MAAANADLLRLADADRRQLEAWLLEFEASWADGRLSASLARWAPPGHPLRVPLLVEMVKIDLERQWGLNRRACVEGYLHTYPELGTPDTVAADLLQAEYEVRRQFHDPVTPDDYPRRFPRQAEEFRRLVREAKEWTGPVPGNRETAAVASTQSGRAHPSWVPQVVPERFGRYRLVGKLGGGGMGTVYLAEDTELVRKVALKVPNSATVGSSELRERFKREARAAAALSHPNLCPVYDVGEIEGIPFFVMAHIEGRPLSDVIAESRAGGRALPQEWCAGVIGKVARALEAAHSRGVIHRDLKPANIMLKKGAAEGVEDDPVVMDFGLARRVQDNRLTGSGMLLGTLPYMPPEALEDSGAESGPGGDIYTLGVIFYELLTGRLPFDKAGMGVAVQIAREEPPRPAALRAEIDPRLEAVCLKAMAKQPKERYASMADFAAALEDWRGAASGPAPRPAPGSRRRVRPPGRLVIAAGAATFLVLGAGFYLSFNNNPTDSGPRTDSSPRKADRPVALPLQADALALATELLDADPWQVAELTTKLEAHRVQVVPLLNAELDKKAAPGLSENAVETRARRRANAAAALFRLGQDRRVLPLLDRGGDPRFRAYLLDRLTGMQGLARAMTKRLKEETAWELQFNGETSHVLTPLRCSGNSSITLEAFGTPAARGGVILGDFRVGGIGLTIYDKNERWHFFAFDGRNYRNAFSDQPVALKRRVHLAGVFDREQHEVRMYVDGVLQAVHDKTDGGFRPSRFPIMIGADPNDRGVPQWFFPGRIKEVRYSKGALYLKTFTPPQRLVSSKNTLLLLHFDEGEGDIAYDSSGNRHHGLIRNATWVKTSK
jgi:serine/threonine protein kinase